MNATVEVFAPANWEILSPMDKPYSGDPVIDACLEGKSDGLAHTQRLITEKLIININRSGKDTTTLLAFLKSRQMNPISAYLRINSWDNFSILIVLPQEEFLDKKMMSVYDYISELETTVSEEMYQIQVSICDTEEGIDENYVCSDGFALKYKM